MTGHLIASKFFKVAIATSFLVALVLSTTTIYVSGSFFDVITHPGFWVFYGKGVLWFFICGVSVSVITQFIIGRQRDLS